MSPHPPCRLARGCANTLEQICANMSRVDSSDLEKWPRPSVAVDVALLTVVPVGRDMDLRVLVHERGPGYGAGRWSLPGTFVHEGERLEQSALRALRDKVGVRGERPQQLLVF